PRLPLRPLVEPRSRAAGDRPGAPPRPAQAGVRAQPDLPRHARGADRPAARHETGARREGDGRPLGGVARRPRPRSDPRGGRALAGRGGGSSVSRGPWARHFAAAVDGDASAAGDVRALRVEAGAIFADVGAVGDAVADAIDRDPSLLLRWRGCIEEADAFVGDPWQGGELPDIGDPRPRPAGTILMRLGDSGVRTENGDVADVLQRAYA